MAGYSPAILAILVAYIRAVVRVAGGRKITAGRWPSNIGCSS